MQQPIVNIDILAINENRVLLGLLSKDWLYEGQQVYGVPGRDLKYKETVGECVKRNIIEELHCHIENYEIISINANYAYNNHYIGIGVLAHISGEIKNSGSKDWEKWEWFELDKIPNNLFPAAKNVIQSYKQHKFTVSE